VSSASLRQRFDEVDDLTVGVEEELLLLEPVTLDPAPAAAWVLAELGESPAHRAELWAAQIELLSGVHDTAAAATADLGKARARLVDHLAGRLRLAGLGTHPLALPMPAFQAGDRYAEIVRQHALGARLGALAAGLHVHVAVAGADRALAVYNALRGHAPLFTAVAANAPYVAGEDSGLATVRPMLADTLPRQGVGPIFSSWSELEDLVEWGRRTGAIADPGRLWWECRPNLRLGTIELRSPDAQSSLEDVHAVAALAHALVAHLCERLDGGERLPAFDTLRIQENRWRAMRYGMRAELLDLEHDWPVPAREVLAELLEQVGAHLEPGGRAKVHALALRNEPAEQRRLARRSGIAAVIARAAERTEAAAGMETDPSGYTPGAWTTAPSSRPTRTGR
jgi:glutamate---cysteine ligase / carboxylate-amine ligase